MRYIQQILRVRKTLKARRRVTPQLSIIIGVSAALLLVGAAAAAVNPNVISMVLSRSSRAFPAAPAKPLANKTPYSTGVPSPSPSPLPSVTPHPSLIPGKTINSQSYGAHLNEATVGTFSNTPMVLSQTSIVLYAGEISPLITATAPDGAPMCIISGSSPDQNVWAEYDGVSAVSCQPQQLFNIKAWSNEPVGNYTVHLQAETSNKVHYDGYISVKVTPAVMPEPTIGPNYPAVDSTPAP